ncbi:hypothetical protein CK203_099667 [Vitis vinifera]|uniref:DUF4283 domain-containing protein n=1 Tax=Vitis vinifera TaxID=29760 RepID=A0A438F1L8_VITVI|nr:hypothetical protein CK203_099667 [Vitis vinifera]
MERERERKQVRESAMAMEGDEGSVPRRRRRECKFSVESKEFEIIGDERKGKFQALIVEKKGGVASWIRLGLDSLGLFLEGLNLCILDEKASGWGREWKEQAEHSLWEEDDLEKLGQHWAKSWELKGSLGLAKMEKGRVLLDFEDLEEARRAVFSGNRTMKGVQIGLDFGVQGAEILKKAGDACGGFITADEPTKTLGELQWARILVRSRGDARPSVLEVEVEEEVYEIALWWECRPVIRRSSSQAEAITAAARLGVRCPHARRSE